MIETAVCAGRVVHSCESPKLTSVVTTIAKAATIEKKYARRENTITAAPSRTLLQCTEMRSPGTDQSPDNNRHDRLWRRSWLACRQRINRAGGSVSDHNERLGLVRAQLLSANGLS